jgi:hypothetical protein
MIPSLPEVAFHSCEVLTSHNHLFIFKKCEENRIQKSLAFLYTSGEWGGTTCTPLPTVIVKFLVRWPSADQSSSNLLSGYLEKSVYPQDTTFI